MLEAVSPGSCVRTELELVLRVILCNTASGMSMKSKVDWTRESAGNSDASPVISPKNGPRKEVKDHSSKKRGCCQARKWVLRFLSGTSFRLDAPLLIIV